MPCNFCFLHLLTSSYIFLPSSYHLWCRWCLWHLCPHQLHGYPGLRLPAATARSGTIWYQYLYECNVALGQDTCDCTSCSSSCGPNVAGVQHYHGSFGRSVSEGYQRLRSQSQTPHGALASRGGHSASSSNLLLCTSRWPCLVWKRLNVSESAKSFKTAATSPGSPPNAGGTHCGLA